MAQDTQVTEKRVKSTVIRRRKEVNPDSALEKKEEAAEFTPKTVVRRAAAAERPVPVEPPPAAQESSAPTVEASAPAPAVTAPVTPAPVVYPAPEKKVPVAVPTGPRSSYAQFAPVRPQIVTREPFVPKTPAEKAAAAAAAAKANPPVSRILGTLPPAALEEEDAEAKKARLKKGLRKKGEGGIEVGLEGLGRVSSMTQLTRLVDRVDRVFQPDKLGKRKKIISKKGLKRTNITLTKAAKRFVEMDKTIRLSDLAHGMGVKSSQVIAKLMGMGTMATINMDLDFDTATLIAQEFQFEVKNIAFNEKQVMETEDVKSENLFPRAPVVTVMGHVDHGKTSLLDAIRSANVADGEAGGITQHIGAYTVAMPKGKITFLDTPGHEAFTAMRARGAKATDIVILVVAADDGLMPQTIESIDHAKAAGVPIVVAINKCDKPEANPDRVKRQLSEHGLVAEEWGGDVQCVAVSAKAKTGIEDLLENVLLQAEVLDLKADPKMKARGVVLESRLDRNRGPIATVLVQQGTLSVGDVVVAGSTWGRIKAMTNYRGESVKQVAPSEAAEILGLQQVPNASDPFHSVADDQAAREVTSHRQGEARTQKFSAGKVSLEDIFAQVQKGEAKELDIILKTDVHGSLEAVSEALVKLSTEKVRLKIIHSGVGGVTESDVLLASASKAIIIGFNVRPETSAIKLATQEGTDIKLYKIIYDMVNEVKLAMQGLLAPTRKEHYQGRAQVRQAFTVSKVGTIAGCGVVDGKIARSSEIRLLRDNVVIHEGKISSLKRFKDDAREVTDGMECGIAIDGYSDIKPGDILEAFTIELIQPEL